jgi:hypothetical protein
MAFHSWTTGDRVGAILSSDADEGTVYFIGYGTYVGDHVPEEAVGFLAEVARSQKRTNPKIELDNGGVVYGCECWWGGEEAVRKKLESFKSIVEVDIDEVRKEIKEEAGQE